MKSAIEALFLPLFTGGKFQMRPPNLDLEMRRAPQPALPKAANGAKAGYAGYTSTALLII